MTAPLADRLYALGRAVRSGASNPTLLKRANRLADDLDADGHADLAARLRTALTRRGESLGTRAFRVDGIRLNLLGCTCPTIADGHWTRVDHADGCGIR